ncbi:transposase [Chryseobacterium lathyri]|uniref:Transposase n=1 Tax=Chryseobacterium lathyri TaxID=395933 RepID=A0ABT9SMV8_9FLAO|nr:transposase [Chryseobacterium lathyri]MDP9960742.1 hypothetical protein [Chryseobacterium lathyri]
MGWFENGFTRTWRDYELIGYNTIAELKRKVIKTFAPRSIGIRIKIITQINILYIMDFKNIHIGQLIEKTVAESGIEMSRICNFLKCSNEDIREMYQSEGLPTNILLRWSKLLEYDFFRLYSQHMILYAPGLRGEEKAKDKKYSLPKFRKSLYTKEIIDFILEQIESEKMTREQVILKYKIPKTTLYKWITKYKG